MRDAVLLVTRSRPSQRSYPLRLRLYPVLDFGGDGVGDVGELWMLLDHVGHHRAQRDDALAVLPGGCQCLHNENGRQTASAEVRIAMVY